MNMTAVAGIGDIVRYEDMANPPRLWLITAVDLDNPWNPYTLRRLDSGDRVEIQHSDLRQAGWSVARFFPIGKARHDTQVTQDNWTVWVGGAEANAFHLTKQAAETLAKSYEDDGYEDVAVTKVATTLLAAGTRRGKAAGSWIIDGNTRVERARWILEAYDEGDPQVYDLEPDPFHLDSCEKLSEILDIEPDLNIDNDFDLEPFVEGFKDGFWTEVIRSAKEMLGILDPQDLTSTRTPD